MNYYQMHILILVQRIFQFLQHYIILQYKDDSDSTMNHKVNV